MDLRLWSRGALEREARRLGVERAEKMRRGELIRAIERTGGAGPDPGGGMLGTAFKVAGALVGVAREAWSARASAGALREGGPPRSAGPGSAASGASSSGASPSGASPSGGSPPGGSPSAGTSPPPREHMQRAAEELAAAEPARRRPAPSRRRPEYEPPADAEPIRTRTMARLLAKQGYYRRALAIYDQLLRGRPDDAELRVEADEVRSQAGEEDAVIPEGEGEVVSLSVDASRVLVSWELDDVSVQRARRVLGAEGTLAARLVWVAPDATTLVRSDMRERRDVPSAGEWVIGELPEGARATASVGITDGERFISIAHAPTVRL